MTRRDGADARIAAVLAALPRHDQPGPGALRDQEYDHLVQALAQWAAQMKRRDILSLLGAAATAACASPLLDRLGDDGLQRIAAAAAGPPRPAPPGAAPPAAGVLA